MKMKNSVLYFIGILFCIFVGGFVFYKTLEVNADRTTQNNLSEAKRIYDAIPVWHKKVHAQQDIKIGIITDTHVRSNRINKNDGRLKDQSPRYLKEKYTQPLKKFVAQMQEFQPEYIIHGGDIIEGTNDPDWLGIMGIDMVREKLEEIDVPIYWVLGNHDLRSVTKAQFKETLGLDSVHQVIDRGDYRFVIIDGNFNPKGGEPSPSGNRYVRGFVPEKELEWLKKQLSTNKRTFVFLHQGAFDYKVLGDGERRKQSISNATELREILREYRVDGFFNGHMEARVYDNVGTTEYFSLTGTTKSLTYPESYYELTITDGDPNLKMFYTPLNSIEIKQVDFESCKDAVDCGDQIILEKK